MTDKDLAAMDIQEFLIFLKEQIDYWITRYKKVKKKWTCKICDFDGNKSDKCKQCGNDRELVELEG